MKNQIAMAARYLTLCSYLLRGSPPSAPHPSAAGRLVLALWVARRVAWEMAAVLGVATLGTVMAVAAVEVADGAPAIRAVSAVALTVLVLAIAAAVLAVGFCVLTIAATTTAPGRWLILSLHGLDRRDREQRDIEPTPTCRLFARLVRFAPMPGLRVLFATTLAFFVGIALECSPTVRAGMDANGWPWLFLSGLLIGLVPVLATRGVRLRHSTDQSIGGGAPLYAAVAVAITVAGMAALDASMGSPMLFLWCAGIFVTGTYEVFLRAQFDVRLMTVPVGFERRLILVPSASPDEVSYALVEHYWPYDPLVANGPVRVSLDSPSAACPDVDWGRRNAGTETLARAILATFWGINDPHPTAVRRIMGHLLLGLEPDTQHVIEFSDLVDAGLTPNEDFESGRFESVSLTGGRLTRPLA